MRRCFNLFAVLAAIAFASPVWAQGTGRSLDIQPGGRENGLGAAGVALGDDPTSQTWWNPAGLGYADRGGLELTYAQLVPGLANDVTYNYGTYVQPLKGWGAFGIGVVFLSYGQSQGTDVNGNPTGTFGSNEFSPAVYYGTRVLPDLSVGVALKYIRIQLAPSSAQGVGSTFGVDLASLYKIPAAHLNLGVNVQNLGPSVTFINEDKADPLGRNVKAGFAWAPYESKAFNFDLVGDFNQSLVTNDFRTYNGGAELRYTDQIAARIGYYSDPLGDIGSITYGLGLSFHGLALDWGSIPQARNSDLANVQKITLGYRFGNNGTGASPTPASTPATTPSTTPSK